MQSDRCAKTLVTLLQLRNAEELAKKKITAFSFRSCYDLFQKINLCGNDMTHSCSQSLRNQNNSYELVMCVSSYVEAMYFKPFTKSLPLTL